MDIWTLSQGADETAKDYISKVTRREHVMPHMDQNMLLYAIIQPAVRKPRTIATLIEAARDADVVVSPTDPTAVVVLHSTHAM